MTDTKVKATAKKGSKKEKPETIIIQQPQADTVDADAPFEGDNSEEVSLELQQQRDAALEEKLEVAKKKFDTPDKWIADAKKKYLKLKISDVEDKEGYESVKMALATVKGKKSSVENIRKELNSDALKYQRAVNAEAKRIEESLMPIIEHLQQEKKVIDDKKEEIKKQKEIEKNRVYLERSSAFIKMGFVLQGDFFVNEELGERMLDMQLRDMDEEWYNDEYAKIHEIVEERRLKKEQDEESARQAQLKLQQEADELRKKAEELEKQQKQMEEQNRKMQEQLDKMNNARKEARLSVFSSMGFVKKDLLSKEAILSCEGVDVNLDSEELFTCEDEVFNKRVSECKSLVDEARSKKASIEEGKAAAAARISSRCAQLSEIGLVFKPAVNAYVYEGINVDNATEICLLPTAEWDALIIKVKERYEAIQTEKKEAAIRLEERIKELSSIGVSYLASTLELMYAGELLIHLSKPLEHGNWDLLMATAKSKIEEKVKAANDEAARKKKDADDKRTEELAAMSDKELLSDYLSRIQAVEKPVMKTAKYKKLVNGFSEFVTNMKGG